MEFTADFFTVLVIVAAISVAVLWLSWTLRIGPVRGTLAALCRVGWVVPLFCGFFPETMTEELPRAVTLKPLHVLIDDSESMQIKGKSEAPSVRATALLKELEAECTRLGCIPKYTYLSEQDDDTANGYTPLSRVLESWLYKVGADPWLLIADGGDFRPTEKWSSSMKGLGRPLEGGLSPRGLIVGFEPTDEDNVWIKDAQVAPFSFEDKPLVIDVLLKRVKAREETERVQLQVMASGTPLATVNASFEPGSLETSITTTIPPLPRGQHLLTIKALPTANERSLWDNTVHAHIEVMPNTVGVLHLLGAPSWDGRFLRRYLKSEPKYDLISFFILRDPWDSQQVNERELSLIPFPVERLFREELPNFRVVIIQNFTLFQFLLPEYQSNLVKFVQEGGGLLFLGGPRSLLSSDLMSSPLREILPFELDEEALAGSFELPPFGQDLGTEESPQDDSGPAYGEDIKFKVEMAKPDSHKRALANVYDDWEGLSESLTGWKSAKGLHHMERVKLKKDTTPLLNAKVGDKTLPLAVASYPGKGRALWLFSDSLWRLAMTLDGETSRQVYNDFMHGAMTWLMRQDLKKPLVATSFSLHGGRREPATWRVALQGPAARYFQPSGEWHITVCGTVIPADKLVAAKSGAEEWEVSGPLPATLAGGERCTFEIVGQHAAFGSVKSAITSVFPEIYKDTQIGAAPQKLEELAQISGAQLALPPNDTKEALVSWLEQTTDQHGIALPSRFKTLRNFYWILTTPWFWLLLLLMPLEVVIRRWDQLFGSDRRGHRREEEDSSLPLDS